MATKQEGSQIASPQAGPLEEPLPLTLRFVLWFGVFVLVGWFAMFWLLQTRW